MLAVRSQTAAGDDTMQVGMVLEGAGPGVEHAGEANLRAEPLRIVSELEQGLRDGLEEQIVEHECVPPGQPPKLGGKGEDDVEVARREDALFPLCDPPGLS